VIAEQTKTGRKFRFAGSFFVDTTGDGNLGALAGAEFSMTIEEGHMGLCNQPFEGGVKKRKMMPCKELKQNFRYNFRFEKQRCFIAKSDQNTSRDCISRQIAGF